MGLFGNILLGWFNIAIFIIGFNVPYWLGWSDTMLWIFKP